MARSLELAPTLQHISGISYKTPSEDSIPALIEVIDETALQGGIDLKIYPWSILESLDLCLDWHWSAYAKLAGVPTPSSEVRSKIRNFYANNRTPKYSKNDLENPPY